MQESQEMWVWSLGREDPLAKEMVTHPSILAWKIPWSEEPGGLVHSGRKELDMTKQHFQAWSLKTPVQSSLFPFPIHCLDGINIQDLGEEPGMREKKPEYESLQGGTRSEQKEHKMLLCEWGINFYCIKALWELFVMVVCLPCEVGCLFKKCSFPSLSHHEWTTHLHSTDGWFGLRDVNRHEVTWYALIHVSIQTKPYTIT